MPRLHSRFRLADWLILTTVTLLALLTILVQTWSEWNAVVMESSRRFRDHKDQFYRSFEQQLTQARSDAGQLRWALDDAGRLQTAQWQAICRQLDDGRWQQLTLVLQQGPQAGSYTCGQPARPLDAASIALARQLQAHHAPVLGDDSSRKAVAGQPPVLSWLYPLHHGSRLAGYIHARYLLQAALDASVRAQPDHAAYALDEGNPLDDPENGSYPPAPMLQSKDWQPGQFFYGRPLYDDPTIPQWLTHWDNLDWQTLSGQPYRLTLFDRSPFRKWYEFYWEDQLTIALTSLLALLIIVTTVAVLRTRQRLHRAADSRRRRLARRARELKQAQEEQQLLEAALLDTSEREKQRLGSELHDGAGQSLTAARLLADSLASTLQPLPPALGALQSCLQQAVNEVRLGARGLTPAPLLEDGLEPALQALASQHEGSGVSVALQVHDTPPRLDPEARLHVYRIAQEAINNAIRHGQASQVTLALGKAPLLTVQDNGCGFDPAAISHGIGLRSQQLRAGLLGRSLQLQTTPGGGTTVCLA